MSTKSSKECLMDGLGQFKHIYMKKNNSRSERQPKTPQSYLKRAEDMISENFVLCLKHQFQENLR